MLQRARARSDTTGNACDMTGRGLRHDLVCATTRRPARGLGVVGAQVGFRVCILCTQPSLDSVHCSESLFESLFMNTIHEHYS